MNKDIFEGQWKKIKGNVKEQWGKLTDDDLSRIDGKRDQLIGAIQTRYGYAKDKAEDELSKFEKKWSHDANHSEHTHDPRAVDDDV